MLLIQGVEGNPATQGRGLLGSKWMPAVRFGTPSATRESLSDSRPILGRSTVIGARLLHAELLALNAQSNRFPKYP